MSETRQTNLIEMRAVGGRTVELSFSSETPVLNKRGMMEVLSHDPSAVDLSRMEAGAALLFEHDRSKQIGIVEKAWIDSETRKGRATVRFSRNQLADEVFRDVSDGIRQLVSVGYDILKAVATGSGSVLVTRWQPVEISFVSIPADTSVGVGRSHTNKHQDNMTTETEPYDERTASLNKRGIQPLTEKETAEVVELCNEHGINAADYILRRTKPDEIRRGILDQQKHDRKSVELTRKFNQEMRANPGRFQKFDGNGRSMSINGVVEVHSDLDQYSVVRAIRIACEGRSFDGLEREVHDELAKSQPEAARGILMPLGLQSRDMTALGSSGAEGGYTIATSKASLLDILRNRLVLRGLGATVFTGLVNNFDLPRGNAGATAGWKAEGVAVDESSQTVAQLSLKPKRLGTFTEVTRQLLAQGSSDVEGWIRNDLIGAVATAWESAAISGDGTGSTPTGILSTAGIGSVAGGTNGLAPTWANIVALESAVANVNADAGSLAYLVNTKTRGKLKTVIRNPSGTDSTFIWPDSNRLNGYSTGVSNAVPSNLTKGSSSGVCSAIVFGNFADLVLAQWGNAIDLLANPYSKDVEGVVRITASTFADAGVRRPASFAAMLDALTT